MILAKIKDKPIWQKGLHERIVSEQDFIEKIKSKDYGSALLQTLNFVNDILLGNEIVPEKERKCESSNRLHRPSSMQKHFSETSALSKISSHYLANKKKH